MNPYTKLLETIERLANLTGVRRARLVEQTRIERNGGTSAQLIRRNRDFNDRLAAVADKIEKALSA